MPGCGVFIVTNGYASDGWPHYEFTTAPPTLLLYSSVVPPWLTVCPIISLAKEKAMYEREAEEQAAKVERMKQEGKDEYDIRKQVSRQAWTPPLSSFPHTHTAL